MVFTSFFVLAADSLVPLAEGVSLGIEMLSAKPIFIRQQYKNTAIQGATILTSVRC